MAFTFDQNLDANIYVNANLVISATRILNYIGRGDFYPTQPVINAIIDELKIFNRALSQKEIQFEMKNNIY